MPGQSPSRLRRAARALVALTLGVAGLPVLASAPVGAVTPSCGSGGTPTVTALADPTFYVDTGASPALLANYTGYTVRPSSALSDAYIKLSGFTGGVISLASTETGSTSLGQLAANEATSKYFLLTASGTTTAAQAHTITLYQGDPALGGSEICTRSFTYNRVADTIKASANKVTSVVSSAASVKPGETITVTVNGTTGTLGAGPSYDPGVLAYTPAVYASFPASSWKLIKTELTISPDGTKPALTYANRLYLSGASGGDRPYTAVYTFTALAPTASPVQITPVQQIASGTQVKHTDLTGLSATFPAIASTASFTVAKTAAVASQMGAGTVRYTVTVSNSGGIGAIDRLIDTMPAGVSYVAGSATLDGTTIADPTISGQTLVFPGPITVPAAVGAVPGTKTYTYQLSLPASVGLYANSAYGTVGSSQIDTTASLLDDVKASASVFVNANPTAVNDTASTTQGTATDITVLTNDTLPALTTAGVDPRVKSVTAVGTPSKGTVSINANNTLHYTPQAGYTGADSFTYTMSDGKGGSSSATVTVNMGPAAANDSYTLLAAVSTASSLAVVANDGCLSCTITSTSVSSTTIATISYSGTTITYTTKAAASITAGSTTDSFTYTITEPTTGYTSTATVSIAFSKAQRDLATTAVNTAVSISVAANDTCKSTGQKCGLTFPSSTTAAGGALSVTNANTTSPTVTYTPPSSTWSGLDTFSYTVDVGTGANSSNQTVTGNTVLVGPGNQTSSVSPNTTTSASVVSSGFSTNCTTCSYTLSGAAVAKGTLTLAGDGTYTYTPNTDITGTDSFGFKVTDNSTGLSSTATHTITITPVATADSASTKKNTTVTVAVLANDVCTSCTVAVTGAPTHGTTSVASNQITYTPTTNYTGADSLTYRITDGAGSQTTATLSLTVVGTPATPVPVTDTVTTAFNTAGTVDVSTNDTSVQAGATFSKASSPSHGTATVSSSGSATFTPTSGYSGTDSFTYQVCQPAPYDTTCATGTVNVVVKPDAVGDTVQAIANQVLSDTVASNDTYAASSTFAKASNPMAGASVTVNANGTYSYTPKASYTGSDSFTYTLCLPSPNQAACATATVSIMVGPSATNDTATTAANTAVSVDALANDGCATCTPEIYSDPSHGAVSVYADGSLLYLPASGYTGTDSFTYLITDANGATASASVTVTISPTAADDSASTPMSTAVAIEYRANDNCTSCSVSFGTPSKGSVSANGNGTAQYVPQASWTGTATFTYTLTDPATSLTATATVSVVVNNAGPDSGTTAYQTAVTLPTSVLANDYCSGCTVTSTGTPGHGAASVTGAGSATYTPDAGFFGRDSFTYTASNGSTTVTGTVTILVGPPVRSLSVTTNTPANGATLTGVTCAECSTTPLAAPGYGGVALASDGTYTYTPDVNYTGADSFTYTMADATSGLSVTGTVNVTVTAPSAPTATDDSFSTGFQTTKTGTTRSNDTGTGTLTTTLVSDVAHGSLTLNGDGTFSYTPAAGYAGDDSFTYTISDTYGQTSGTATVSFTVGKPDAPTATGETFSTGFGVTKTGTTRSNDTGTGTLTTNLVSDVTHGSLTLNANGTFSYTPAAGYAGDDSFTYSLSDTYAQSSGTVTVTITVAKPAAPTAVDDSFTTAFETELTGTTRTNDTGTGTLTAGVVLDVAHGSLSLNGDGSFSYTPDEGFAGEDGFTYELADTYGQYSSVAVVSITVAKPAAPVAGDDWVGGGVNVPVAGTTRTNDSGTGTLSTHVLSGPAHGELTLTTSTGAFSYTPSLNFSGDDSFTYEVCDTYDQCTEATVTITIGTPAAPVAAADSVSVSFGATKTGTTRSNDTGTGTLTTTLGTDVAHGTLTLNANGTFTYTPDVGFAGEDSFSYTLCDAYDQCDGPVTVSLTVGKPAAPEATADSFDTPFEATKTGTTRSNDTGTGTLTATLGTDVTHGTLTLNANGTFTYTPDNGFAGEDSFTYTLCDGYEQCDGPVTVTITVAKPAAPVASADSFETAFETELDATTRNNDTGTGTLTANLITDVTHGTLILNANGTFTYTPADGFAGEDAFSYELCDSYDQCDGPVTVSLTVGRPDTPVAGDDAFTTPFETELDATTRSNDTGTGTLTANLITGVEHGTLTLYTNGGFIYLPDDGFAGQDAFSYELCDSYDQCSAYTSVTIAVGLPAVPTADDDQADGAFAAQITGTTRSNDTGTGPLTTSLVGDATHGTLSLNTDGTFTYTPAEGFAGEDSFSYELCDAYDQCSAAATVTITVAKPAAPEASADSFETPFETELGGTTRSNDDGTGVLTTTLDTDVVHGTLELGEDGSFTYTPDVGFAGEDSFSYTLGDSYGQSSGPVTVTITVGKPDAPVAGDDAFTTPFETELTGTTRSNDSGTGSLVSDVTGQPEHGEVTMQADGTFTYTPDEMFAGEDSFTYELCDSYTQCSVDATVTIVVDTPAAPVAMADEFTTPFETALTGTTRSNDTGTGLLFSERMTQPTHGRVTVDGDGSFTYTPDDGFAGEDSFTYLLVDVWEQTGGPVTVTITVDKPAAPVAGDDTFTVPFAVTLVEGTRGNDTGTGTLTTTLVEDAAHGTLSVNANGSFSYTATNGYWGHDSFTYTVSDAYGQHSGVATVRLTVEPDPTSVTITGILWFDRNHDGVRDPDEPLLPGADVTATPQAQSSRLRVGLLGVGLVPAHTQHLGAGTVKTDATGRYTFTHLSPGGYLITASARVSGLEPGWDPDGAADWRLELNAVPGVNEANMATSGQGALGGTVILAGSERPIPFASVVCTWAGIDTVLGTEDDVEFITTADDNGAFTVDGIPFGAFTCTGTDPVTRQASSVTVELLSAQPVRTTIPLVESDTPVTASTPPRSGPLAVTGGEASGLVAAGAALLGSGVGLIGLSRRRRRRDRREGGDQ